MFLRIEYSGKYINIKQFIFILCINLMQRYFFRTSYSIIPIDLNMNYSCLLIILSSLTIFTVYGNTLIDDDVTSSSTDVQRDAVVPGSLATVS